MGNNKAVEKYNTSIIMVTEKLVSLKGLKSNDQLLREFQAQKKRLSVELINILSTTIKNKDEIEKIISTHIEDIDDNLFMSLLYEDKKEKIDLSDYMTKEEFNKRMTRFIVIESIILILTIIIVGFIMYKIIMV